MLGSFKMVRYLAMFVKHISANQLQKTRVNHAG